MRVGPTAPQGVPGDFVDRIIEAERIPVETARSRRGKVQEERNEYAGLSGLVSDLGSVVSKMKAPPAFEALAFESSHPDIIDGLLTGPAMPGTYEMEVRGLARPDRHLEVGFPDADQTPVGFGYMEIEKVSGGSTPVTIEPGDTLQDVARRVSDADPSLKAMVVNTGMAEDPFRLMVSSAETGEEMRINIDPDTTFLDFSNIRTGRGLDVMFEDVGVTRSANDLQDLLPGVKMTAKRAEPGTRVQVNVRHDVDATTGNIMDFVDKYNKVAEFANQQFTVAPDGMAMGRLAGAGDIRSLMRSVQGELGRPQAGGRFSSLAEVGFSTNPKTGVLQVDESKLKSALATDYAGVSRIFTGNGGEGGLFDRMSQALKRFQDPVSGVIAGRLKTLDRSIKDQDRSIEKAEERLREKELKVKDQMARLSGRMEQAEATRGYIAARIGQQQQ